jgi:hypothetical protein
MSRSRCLWPTAVVLALGATTLAGLAGGSYHLGRANDARAPELQFLRPGHAPTVDEACLTLVGEYAVRSQEANDVIFLGDSACRMDLDPLSFESRTGLRAYNLGTFGTSGPNVLAVIAKSYLANHPWPRAIVLCLSPISLRYETRRQAGSVQWRFAQVYGSRAERPHAPDARSVVDSIGYAMRRGAGLVADTVGTLGRVEAPDALDVPLIGMPEATYSTLGDTVRAQRGHWVLRGHEKEANGHDWPSAKKRIFISPDWDRGLDEIAELCKRERILLVFRAAPLRADGALRFDVSQAVQCLEAARSRNPWVALKRPILSYCDWSQCWDAMHLNDKGAEQFTAIVARDVQDALRGARVADDRLRSP